MAEENDRYRLLLKYPASWWGNMWREALPSGNGKIGAAVYGGVQSETILINHADLWHWGHKDPLPDLSYTLPLTRRLMSEGRYSEASWLLTNALKDQGYNTRLAATMPLADLKLEMAITTGFKHYRRILDMETGEVTVAWDEAIAAYKRRLFVSRVDDLIVYEVSGAGGLVDAAIRLAPHQGEDKQTPVVEKELEASLEIKTEANYLYYAAQNDDGTDFGAVLRLETVGGALLPGDGALTVVNAEKMLILAKVFVKGDRNDVWPQLRRELAAVSPDYNALFQAHVRLHRPLFLSAEFQLDVGTHADSNEELLLKAYEGEAPVCLLEKLWAYGRYLFISATRQGGLPCGLYGLWGGGYRLMWCHNMANENIQMIYWHAFVGGLTGLTEAFYDYYDNLLPDFKNNAANLFGCRGIYVPAGSTPEIGAPNQIVPVIMNWTGAAGWLARHFYDYYLYTGDLNFLKQRALPFMREAALFYEDFLLMGEDGYYRIYPSVSPENTPLNFMPAGGKALAHPMPTAINATMDFAILKELLSQLTEGSRTAGVYQEEQGKWEAMLKHIPPYQVNRDGAIAEWMHPDFEDRYEHRHLSHLYPVFPGQEIVKEEQPELFRAFEIAVKKRLLGAQSGWSLAHMACIYARLGDGDRALECLELLTRSCLLNNFFTLHNDWRDMGICMTIPNAPVQLDANMGVVNALQEMVLYVSEKLIKILPACPRKWLKGRVKKFRYCTGEVSFFWDFEAGVFAAELQATRDTKIHIILPPQFKNYTWQGHGDADTVEIHLVDNDNHRIDVIVPAAGRVEINGSL